MGAGFATCPRRREARSGWGRVAWVALAVAAFAAAAALHALVACPVFPVHTSGLIVVTGASTGIGRAAAVQLAGLGFTVLAGVRQAADGAAVLDAADAAEAVGAASGAAAVHGARARIRPVVLDVTQPATLDAAAAAARALGLPVVGLFCNAGIAHGILPAEFRTIKEHRAVFAVNYFGVLETVARFVPLIRAAGGRIVLTGSVSGHFATPFFQPYSASKFAVRSLADSLRRELAPAGVSVSRLEPGFVRTPMFEKSGDPASFERLSPALRAPYAALFGNTARKMAHFSTVAGSTVDTDIAVVHAFTAPRPRAVYAPGTISGRPALAFIWLMGSLEARWQDLLAVYY